MSRDGCATSPHRQMPLPNRSRSGANISPYAQTKKKAKNAPGARNRTTTINIVRMTKTEKAGTHFGKVFRQPDRFDPIYSQAETGFSITATITIETNARCEGTCDVRIHVRDYNQWIV